MKHIDEAYRYSLSGRRPDCDIISFNVHQHDLFPGHIRSFSTKTEVGKKITISETSEK